MHSRTSFVVFALLVGVSVWMTPGCGDQAANSDSPARADVLPEVYDPPADADINLDEIVPDPVPVTVDTLVDPAQVVAGQPVPVTCKAYDDEGNEVALDAELTPRIFLAPEESFAENDAGEVVATRVGDAIAACAFASLGLLDETPAEFEIVPGPAETVVTTLDRSNMQAGESAGVSCEVYDAWGNLVPDAAPTVQLSPQNASALVDGAGVTTEEAGLYSVTCSVAGATYELGAELDVHPALPAALVIAKVPDQQVYSIGQIVGIAPLVTDRYGNLVDDAVVHMVSSPSAADFGNHRFRFDSEGLYTITATVAPPTDGDVTLEAQTTVLVNSTGPQLQCVSPADLSMLDRSTFGSVTFQGQATDVNGVQSVTVNGNTVTVGSDGTFSTSVPIGFGINFVDIVATDTFGEENSRTCAFLVASNWRGESEYLNDDVTLKLAQRAVDDGYTADLDSLNDLLYRVLNSQGLIDTLHAALLASNPLKPNSCDQQVCVPLIGCSCVFRSEVRYRQLAVGGPHTTSLTLVTGGLQATARVNDIGIKVDVSGTVGTTGWAYVDYVSVQLTFDIDLVNGSPKVTVRSVDSVSVGAVDLDFPGFTGLIIDILQTLFQGTIRNMIRDTLRDYIRNNFNQVLDSVLSGLDVSTLGTSISVPQLDGTGTVTVGFGLRFSSVSALSTRALFGLGTRFTGSSAHARSSLGVPLPTGVVRLSPSTTTTTRPVAAAVHVGLFNQVLHRLWRGGLFDADVGNAVLGGGFPAGTSADLQTFLPPVAALDGDDIVLMLGGVRLSLVYPGIFDTPITVTLGAKARSAPRLVGSDLRFDSISVDELHFSTDAVSLDQATRDVLEDFLISLVQHVVDPSINDALPAIPIPSFTIPSSLSVYGLPAGSQLGVKNPTLSTTSRHFVLTGAFGTL